MEKQLQLPQCFLGKTVYLEEKQAYTIKYQDNRNKDGIHVLLFEGEKPVIFAVLNKDGSFYDAFFTKKKSNHSSTTALNRYNSLAGRKAQKQIKQDDLKDALHNENDAKMKNENIFKLLVDEHLEDISNGWPSRLIQLQMNEFKCHDSLINASLKEALKKANPHKAFYFLTLHRYDDLLHELTDHLPNHNNLLDKISTYYQTYNSNSYLFSFLKHAAKTVPLNDIPLIQSTLAQTYTIDIQNKCHYFKPIFLLMYKRVKNCATIDTKEWLKQLSKVPLVKKGIQSVKKK